MQKYLFFFVMSWTERTELLLGEENVLKLASSRVAVVGLGGVGAYAAEMLCRSGVGSMLLVDNDTVSLTNINRQLPALHSTIGRPKIEVVCERLRDINPDVRLECVRDYLTEGNVAQIITGDFDYVVDAIDTLSPKIALIRHCLAKGYPLVSSMGSGAKTDATKVRLADISRTYQCPLAHMLRKRLHKLGIREGFLAVFSEELPARESVVLEESANKKSQVGTISYIPAVFGCVCAQAAVQGIVGIR